jgi:predicted TIM-barrel fold metal-dependent hydrolase
VHQVRAGTFARQCRISFEIDEPSLRLVLPVLGEDRAVWGSDYPHHDSTFPGAVQARRETIAPLPDETRSRVLGTNALDCYNLR